MGDPKTTAWQQFWQQAGPFLTKVGIWTTYISIGVLAKLAADSRVGKLSRRQVIIKTVLSIFTGVLAAIACETWGFTKWGKIVVPVATLLGEGIIVYVMTNWEPFFTKFLSNYIKTKDKTEEKK